MKKICISLLAIFCINSLLAQLGNNHWQLGVSDVNFSTNPPVVINNSTNVGKYGNASVSDSNGNLLFYSDGKSVWNKNNQLMQNFTTFALASRPEAEQSVIIVPYPNQNKYYIFAQRSDNLLCCGINLNSYVYGLVDFTSNPLGSFQSLGELYGPTSTGSIGLIQGYGSRHGGLTLAKNSAGTGYWIILSGAVQGGYTDRKIYSFSITSTGLNLTPVVSNYVTSFGATASDHLERLILKISPDNTTLGVVESNRYNDPTGICSFRTFNFNSATGAFTNQTTVNILSGNLACNSFEFSSDSKKVYFVNTNLLVKDLSNTVLARSISLPVLSTDASWHIQRDRFENILIARNKDNLIGKIDNQNSYSLASISSGFINLVTSLRALTINETYTLPQLIPELNVCQSDKIITGPVTATQDFRVSSLITASSAISNNLTVNYRAKDILLKAGFFVSGNSTGKFRAHIDPCVLGAAARISSLAENIIANEEAFDRDEPLTVYPNPNSGVFNVSLNETAGGLIEIYDTFGVKIFNKEFRSQQDIAVDIQDKPNGVYIVKVLSKENVLLSKIIKR
jgi:hypothetical protein